MGTRGTLLLASPKVNIKRARLVLGIFDLRNKYGWNSAYKFPFLYSRFLGGLSDHNDNATIFYRGIFIDSLEFIGLSSFSSSSSFSASCFC